MNAKVFINYRREDSAPYAGRLYDRLAAHFGEDQVFIDIDQIQPGEDLVEAINRKVGTCDIAIVAIGPNWLHATDASGNRRLDDAEDFVRMEIVAALERQIRVIPILVGGAQMPRKQDLPEALAPLSRRNAIELSETRFHADVNQLIEAIEKSSAVAATEGATRPVKSTQTTPAPPPVPSTSSTPALKEFEGWIWEHRILVGAIVLMLSLAGVLTWLGHQKVAKPANQPAIANLKGVAPNIKRVAPNIERVVGNPKGLSNPAEPKSTDQGNSTTRRMGQIEEGIRLQGYNLNPNPILVKSADECSKQCEQTDSCLAMTFVKHPNQSGRGDCWLKSAVPPRSSAPPNFASAVKN